MTGHQLAAARVSRSVARERRYNPCALCQGHGDVVNPANSDPARKVTDWLPPVGCPRCGQSGIEPNP